MKMRTCVWLAVVVIEVLWCKRGQHATEVTKWVVTSTICFLLCVPNQERITITPFQTSCLKLMSRILNVSIWSCSFVSPAQSPFYRYMDIAILKPQHKMSMLLVQVYALYDCYLYDVPRPLLVAHPLALFSFWQHIHFCTLLRYTSGW